MIQTALRFLDGHKEIDLTPTPPLFKHFDLMTGEVSNGFVGERFKNK